MNIEFRATAVLPDQKPYTPLAYLGEILTSSWRHGGELSVAVGGVVAVGITARAARALLHLQAFGGASHLLSVLLPPIGLILLFEASVAAWRLHRRQSIALATSRSLLDWNARERIDLERSLVARTRRLEARMNQRYAANVGRLTGEIARLHAEARRQPL